MVRSSFCPQEAQSGKTYLYTNKCNRNGDTEVEVTECAEELDTRRH